jgi:predicted ATP-grasp superfamily ATP-dependent carboligase
MKRILLTGARAPVALDLARKFSKAGHTVYLADSIALPLARWSRSVKRTFQVPAPASNPVLFVNALESICRSERIDLLIPTCEEIFFVASGLEQLQKVTQVLSESFETMHRLHSKWQFVQLIENLALEVQAPESHLLCDAEALEAFVRTRNTKDWVFKPVYSRFASRTCVGPEHDRVSEIRPSESDPWLAQRRIKGQEFSTFSISSHGRVCAHACYRSKYRAGVGAGIYFLNVIDPRIQSFVDRFSEKMHFTGQVGFDFMYDEDGTLYVLECNPRSTSGLHMFEDLELANAYLQPTPEAIVPTSETPRMLGAVLALCTLPSAIVHGTIRSWISDYARARDVIFSWRDPLPMLLSPFSILEIGIRAIRTGNSLSQASTMDIEWNGEDLQQR